LLHILPINLPDSIGIAGYHSGKFFFGCVGFSFQFNHAVLVGIRISIPGCQLLAVELQSPVDFCRFRQRRCAYIQPGSGGEQESFVKNGPVEYQCRKKAGGYTCSSEKELGCFHVTILQKSR
jgi:hypothetical protein